MCVYIKLTMTEGCSVWIMAESPSSTAVTLSDALTFHNHPAIMAIITIIPAIAITIFSIIPAIAIIFDAATQN